MLSATMYGRTDRCQPRIPVGIVSFSHHSGVHLALKSEAEWAASAVDKVTRASGGLVRDLQSGWKFNPIQFMTPIDTAVSSSSNQRTSMAPPYVDEDVNADLVQRGLDEAEDETRDLVADTYEASALESDEAMDALDDIDFTESEGISSIPELAAMHEGEDEDEESNDLA